MLIKGSLLLLLAELICLFKTSSELCETGSCGNGDSCRNQQRQDNNCFNFEKIINEENKLAILNKINSRRNQIASGEIRSLPSAENMSKMIWNEMLATSAQTWAEQCVPRSYPELEDSCRHMENAIIGQNIASIYGEAPGLSAASLVDVWYTELLDINATFIPRYRQSKDLDYPHYDYFTQLAWATSFEVGCGGVRLKQTFNNKNETVHRLVCNFAPAGNILDEPVYVSGVPCSRCIRSCDQEFNALCYTDTRNSITKIHSTENKQNFTKQSKGFKQIGFPENSTTSEDILPVFDYFSHLHDYTRQEITATSKTPTSCKDVLAVDELLELLKKKLTSDPIFKDVLGTRKSLDSTDLVSDKNVDAFVDRVYNKHEQELSTTEGATESDFVNSTLLSDLLGAVIFRDRFSVTAPTYKATKDYEIRPLRIQASLTEIPNNNEKTGHYFFPEDPDESVSENHTETVDFYDSTRLPISDIVSELENLRNQKDSNSFLEEILEEEASKSETMENDKKLKPDNMMVHNEGHANMKKFLDEIIEKSDQKSFIELSSKSSIDTDTLSETFKNTRRRRDFFRKVQSNMKNDDIDYAVLKKYRKTLGKRDFHILQYSELLKKMANDLRILRLNNRFHCSKASQLNSDFLLIHFVVDFLFIIKKLT